MTSSVQQELNQLARSLDAATLAYLSTTKKINLRLIGGETVFLNAIRNKIARLGLKNEKDWPCPYIIDNDSEEKQLSPTDSCVISRFDIDCCTAYSAWANSCDAEACFKAVQLLHEQPIHVGIIGRGRAVGGLARRLLAANYTITQCHSHTPNVTKAVANCDCIIYAVPRWIDAAFPNEATIIDVSYQVPKEQYPNALHIGSITTSLILLRAATAMGI